MKDLPTAWNERMHEYLGVDVPDDAHGVLQDMHWPGGSFGYFPTYSLGNVMSVQIFERAKEDLGELDDRFERGDFGDLRVWLNEHLHRLGRRIEDWLALPEGRRRELAEAGRRTVVERHSLEGERARLAALLGELAEDVGSAAKA